MIWEKSFCKLRVSFDRLVITKEVFLKSSHIIEAHLYVLVKTIEIQSSVYFELCLDEDIIEFRWDDLMFYGPHATNFGRVFLFQWWRPPVSWNLGGRVWRSRCIHLGWCGCQSGKLFWDYCEHYFEFYCELRHFIIVVLLVGLHILFVALVAACMMMNC